MKNVVISALGFALLMSTSAMAAPSWEDVSFQAAMRAGDSGFIANTPGVKIRAASRYLPSRGHSTTGAPAVLATFVTAGITNPGVPCFACVPSAQNPNMTAGLSSPLNYIDHTLSNVDYIFFLQDESFSGKCAFSIVITQGTATLFKAAGHFTFAPQTSSTYIATGGPPTAFSGQALLVGKITCPGSAASSARTTLYYF